MSGALVLVVEDEPQVARFLRASLSAHGYRLLEAHTLAEATRFLTSQPPDVVLLDLGLPDGDGLELVREVRGWSRVPILVVSARGREADKVAALDAGADDYLTKPFGVDELLARIRVALRHATASPDPTATEVGPFRVDHGRREVSRDGEPIHLTPTEYRLFGLLVRHVGKVVTHAQILREVWGPNHQAHAHYVRVYVAELRRKLEPDPDRPRWLVTEPGVGYRLRDA